MGTISKTIYEAPTIHLKQVMMESDIMAASNDPVVIENDTHADIDQQGGWDETNKGVISTFGPSGQHKWD